MKLTVRSLPSRGWLSGAAIAIAASMPNALQAQQCPGGLPLLVALPAATVEAMESINGDTPTTICFNNETSGSVDVFWMDYTGVAKFYKFLSPGQFYEQETFFTHPWLITSDPSGGSLVQDDPLQGTPIVGFLPNRDEAEADIIDPNGGVTGTPEPATLTLFASGFLAVAGVAARRKRSGQTDA